MLDRVTGVVSSDSIERKDILNLIKTVYNTVVYVDLTADSHKVLYATSDEVERSLIKLESNSAWFEVCADIIMVYREDFDEFRKFCDVDRISSWLRKGEKYMCLQFRRLSGGQFRWSLMEIVAAENSSYDELAVYIYIRDVDEDYRRHIEEKNLFKMVESNELIKNTILLVEDDDISRTLLYGILAPSYKVITAGNGREALSVLERDGDAVSLIILDLYMPEMNGYEFISALKEHPTIKMIPIIVTTSHDTADEEIKCFREGVFDFISKPYSSDVIISRVNNAIKVNYNRNMLSVLRMDNVTGLYSREYFTQMAEQMLYRNPDIEYDVICSEIENFRAIKEQYGIKIGKAILQYVANQYRKYQCDGSIIGMVRPEMFAMIVPHGYNAYEQMKYSFKPENIDDKAMEFGIPKFVQKFGVYEKVDRSKPVLTMCDRAQIAMGTIKGHYGDNVAKYDSSMRDTLVKNQKILTNMEEAIRSKQFQVWFQPKHDLCSGKVVGAEALVRWIHPQYGYMSPGEFIPVFEANGFVTKVDHFVWEQTFEAISRWRKNNMPVVPISINMSRMDFIRREDTHKIITLAKQYNIDPKDVHLEVTETAYMDNPGSVLDGVNELKDYGFAIEMDDFGSGYSSLSVFGEMPVDVLKLDMLFIQQKQSDKGDKTIKYIIDLAKALDLKVIAEGVETVEQASRLQNMGCDYAQGFFYSRPIPMDEFEEYVLNAECCCV